MKVMGYLAIGLFLISAASAVIGLLQTLTRKDSKKANIVAIASFMGIILLILISAGNKGKKPITDTEQVQNKEDVYNSDYGSGNTPTTTSPISYVALDTLEETVEFTNNTANIGKSVQFTAIVDYIGDDHYGMSMDSGNYMLGRGLIPSSGVELYDEVLYTGSFAGISESYVNTFDTISIVVLNKGVAGSGDSKTEYLSFCKEMIEGIAKPLRELGYSISCDAHYEGDILEMNIVFDNIDHFADFYQQASSNREGWEGIKQTISDCNKAMLGEALKRNVNVDTLLLVEI